MIINETYDEILEKLDDYGLISEGYTRDCIYNNKLIKQAMNVIKDQINSKVSECKRCSWYYDSNYFNIIRMEIKLNGRYSESEINRIKSDTITPIINSVCSEINPKFKSLDDLKYELTYNYRNILYSREKRIAIDFICWTEIYD